MDKGNDEAFHQLAGYYAAGTNGMPQNWIKANELYLKAGELGECFHIRLSFRDKKGYKIHLNKL